MRDEADMRTTLAIDDDVLIAAKAMATQQHRSVGEVISELARRSLRRPPSSGE
ncbi:CopG family transcriptional regulator, partial [Rhizobium laguerreae]|nr:CopG family transcriptional regulator [Rhizobium laguerreae]